MARYRYLDNANEEVDRLRDRVDWLNRSWTLAQRVIDTMVAYVDKRGDPALKKAYEAAVAAYARHKRYPPR